MKPPITKPAGTPQTPVFPIAIRQRVSKQQTAAATTKPEKRDNIFSKSRDTREDRGARQVKTTNSAQTFPHAR